MVLNELGDRLSKALRALSSKAVVDEEALDILLKEIAAALLAADVSISIIKRLRDNVKTKVNLTEIAPGMNKQSLIKKIVVSELVSMLDPGKTPYKMIKGRPNVIMFVGLQGAGKTTTIAKYAHYYKSKHFKVGMVCADTFRAGAYDQLKQNAVRVKVAHYGSYTEMDPVRIATEGVDRFKKKGFDVIIVDTSGRHKQEGELFEEMQDVAASTKPDEIIFVMDSTNGKGIANQAKAFGDAVSVGSVIVTKLDGNAKGGGALSAVAETNSPITFIGTGEHFESFEPFRPSSFVSKLLGEGDIEGLIDTMKDVAENDATKVIMDHMSKGLFTLRDMYEQLKIMPIGKIMGMLPGAFGQMMGGAGGGVGQKRIDRFCSIMDSMTNKELDGLVKFNESRVARVACGAGVRYEEVEALLFAHKQFAKMIKGLGGKHGLMGKGGMTDAKLAQKMSRDPRALVNQLSKINPGMVKQMGGASGLQSLMKSIGGMDMGKLAGMMPGMGGGGMGGGSAKGGRRRRG